MVVGLGCLRHQQSHHPVAQKVLNGHTVGGQFELVRPLARVDDAPLGIHRVFALQTTGAQGVFQQEAVIGHLDEVLVAGRLAGLDVPHAQHPVAVDLIHFEQVGPGRAHAHARRIKPEPGQKMGCVFGSRLQIDENLGQKAGRRRPAQALGQLIHGQRPDCLPLAFGLKSVVE